MCRSDKFASVAFEQAELSTLKFKVGACITKGSKVIVKGHNTPRTRYMNTNYLCTHGEMECAREFLHKVLKTNLKTHIKSLRNKNYRRQMKKYIVWVVRRGFSDTNYMQSVPCKDCKNSLIELGFEKVGYSNIDGNIVVTKLKNIDGILSEAQLNYYENLKK
tara:strand:+ start:2518 stop:3003 length:486 start_codon:yes stop_codon:yes gene_type:complete